LRGVPQSGRAKQSFSTLYSLLSTLLILTALLSYGYYRLNQPFLGETLRASVIQGNIPQSQKWDSARTGGILDRYRRLTYQAAKDKPQFIIWPETSVPGDLEGEPILLGTITELAKEVNIPLLIGTIRADDESNKYFNNATLIDKSGDIIKSYSKLHLVPFGEFIPLENVFGFLRNIAPIGDFKRGIEYTVFNLGDVKFSSLICFEDIFPSLVRRFAKNGAGLLINITNDAWFGDTSEPYQHAQASVFRAVELRRAVIRAANTGLSCFINPKGEIIASVKDKVGKEIFVSGYKTAAIPLVKTRSIYTHYGDWLVALCLLFVLTPLIKYYILTS